MAGLEPALLWLAGICTAIMAIWGLIAKVKAGFESYMKPLKDKIADHDTQLAQLQEMAKDSHAKLLSDHERLTKQTKVNELLLKFAANSLQHELTGNHTEEMKACSKEIESFIYKEGGLL